VQNDINSNVFDLAVRVYPERVHEKRNGGQRRREPVTQPEAMFVFDTETRVDATQRLTFGSYRFIVSGRCLEEGLFYADDLTEDERRTLEAYAESHRAETVPEGNAKLKLLSLSEFLDRLYRCQGRTENFPLRRSKRGPLRPARERRDRAGGDSPPVLCLALESGNRRRSCGNVGISPLLGEISKGLVERVGSLRLAFHAFHSPAISTALFSTVEARVFGDCALVFGYDGPGSFFFLLFFNR
jgi:hypothetical protein